MPAGSDGSCLSGQEKSSHNCEPSISLISFAGFFFFSKYIMDFVKVQRKIRRYFMPVDHQLI